MVNDLVCTSVPEATVTVTLLLVGDSKKKPLPEPHPHNPDAQMPAIDSNTSNRPANRLPPRRMRLAKGRSSRASENGAVRHKFPPTRPLALALGTETVIVISPLKEVPAGRVQEVAVVCDHALGEMVAVAPDGRPVRDRVRAAGNDVPLLGVGSVAELNPSHVEVPSDWRSGQ